MTPSAPAARWDRVAAAPLFTVAPAAGCDATTVGTDTSSGYSADYYFYSGGGASAWLTADISLDLVFQTPADEMWEAAIRRLGAEPGSLQLGSGVH